MLLFLCVGGLFPGLPPRDTGLYDVCVVNAEHRWCAYMMRQLYDVLGKLSAACIAALARFTMHYGNKKQQREYARWMCG